MIRIFLSRFSVLLLTFLLAFQGVCTELVGVVPFSNQRSDKQADWIGFYFQARIEDLLRKNSNWQFHPLGVLRLWQYKSGLSKPISPDTTILIKGSFQKVLKFGYLYVQVEKNLLSTFKQKSFEITFDEESIEKRLDELAVAIGKWIQPDFKITHQSSFRKLKSAEIKKIFLHRQIMYLPGNIPEIKLSNYLFETISLDSSCSMIGDSAEGMIVLSQFVEKKRKESLLHKVELRLRKATIKQKKCAHLFALLAETFYLKEYPLSWVEKSAGDAVRLDPQDDLGYILLTLAQSIESPKRRESLLKLKAVNPWLWVDSPQTDIQFQKGILQNEIHQLITDRIIKNQGK